MGPCGARSASSSSGSHLRRTLPIALCVGVVLTSINHGDTILSGNATDGTVVKLCLNFVVPFVVSNLGLLAGKRAEGSL